MSTDSELPMDANRCLAKAKGRTVNINKDAFEYLQVMHHVKATSQAEFQFQPPD